MVEDAKADPLVAAVFARFPGAEIVDVRIKRSPDEALPPPPPVAAPIGKYPVGKYPVGKYPVGKYPQPVVPKG